MNDDGSTNCNMRFVPKWDLEFQFDSTDHEERPSVFDFRVKGEDAEIRLGEALYLKGTFDAETQRIVWHGETAAFLEAIGDDANDEFARAYHEMRRGRYLKYGEV